MKKIFFVMLALAMVFAVSGVAAAPPAEEATMLAFCAVDFGFENTMIQRPAALSAAALKPAAVVAFGVPFQIEAVLVSAPVEKIMLAGLMCGAAFNFEMTAVHAGIPYYLRATSATIHKQNWV